MPFSKFYPITYPNYIIHSKWYPITKRNHISHRKLYPIANRNHKPHSNLDYITNPNYTQSSHITSTVIYFSFTSLQCSFSHYQPNLSRKFLSQHMPYSGFATHITCASNIFISYSAIYSAHSCHYAISTYHCQTRSLQSLSSKSSYIYTFGCSYIATNS